VAGGAGRRFPRAERLKKRKDVTAVFRRGHRAGCEGAELIVRKNGLGHNRIVFTFVRKFGNSVERNRARRVGREAYRHLRGALRGGFDMVLRVFPGTDTFARRMEQMTWLFGRLGLFADSAPPDAHKDAGR